MIYNGFADLFKVVPRRAFAKHCIHTAAHFCKRVFLSRRFVTAPYAGGDIGIQPLVSFGYGIMSSDYLASLERLADYVMRMFIRKVYSGKVHHLAEPDAFVPDHCLLYIGGVYFRARILEAVDGRDARRRSQHDL